MTIPAFTARTFSATVPSRPWNAVFFPDRVLFDIAKNDSGAFSSVDRAAALSELAVRYFLSRDNKFQPVLENEIGEDFLRNFLDRCAFCTQGRTRLDDLRRSLAGSADGTVAEWLCLRFHRLLSADGAIPVFGGSDREGFLLPFSFVGSVPSGGTPAVFDADDNPVAAWSAAMRHLPEPVGANVRVDAHLGADAGWEPPVGSSLLLPVLAAWWRKQGKLPSYDPLRLLFTGSFRGGLLRRVETAETKKAVSVVKDGRLSHPSAPGSPPTRTTLPEGSDASAVLASVRALAEEVSVTSVDYAKKRMRDFETDVRQNRFAGWTTLLRRLENVCARLNGTIEPEAWLSGRLILAAANCHAGRTAEAARFNAEAIAFCEKNPARFEDGLLRALVDQQVILQDDEDFDFLHALAPDLEARLAAFASKRGGDETSRDLWMRFHGTMGQFHAYANLAGVRTSEYTPESAKRHFDAALETARALRDAAATEDARSVRAADVAHDANYLLLWHSLFDPAGVCKSFEDALAAAGELRKDDPSATSDTYRKNLLFAHRDAALGLYRAVLQGREIPALPPGTDFKGTLESADEQGWIAGTTAKYLGAVAAAKGEEDEAARLFDIAIGAMKEDLHGILGVIRMTVLAEAFRSLRRFASQAGRAESCRKKALAFFDSGDSAAEAKWSWRDWLETPDAAPFPGLSYWY